LPVPIFGIPHNGTRLEELREAGGRPWRFESNRRERKGNLAPELLLSIFEMASSVMVETTKNIFLQEAASMMKLKDGHSPSVQA